MKPLFNFILFLTLIICLFSCTYNVKLSTTKTKSLPIIADLNGSTILKQGKINSTDLLKLLDIPSDSKVEKFEMTGITLDINPKSGTEADFIKYRITFLNNVCAVSGILVNEKRHFVSTGESFNISSELDPTALTLLKQLLGSLVILNPSCNPNDVNYTIEYNAIDVNGNPKNFNGTITGNINFQVVYSVCEELPKWLATELPLCK